MKRIKTTLLIIFFLQTSAIIFAQQNEIQKPAFDDKYSHYVEQLESGQTNIDYADFRNSFLQSGQFAKKGMNYDKLKSQVFSAIKNNNYQEVIRLTKAMLSIDYTSMFAHKFLQQTYGILGDTLNQKKYHDIEFGLLYSIINSGDGKSCERGWHVTQIEEEYFILSMMGAQLQSQSTSDSPKNQCDRMVVKTQDGEVNTYYFEANKVFEMERKMFDK
jgi:hypothetical protein